MKATTPTPIPSRRSLLRILGVPLLALMLAACSTPVEVTPDDESVDAPLPEPETQMYQVDIDFKRIRVVGDCEADPIFVVKGRFAYRLSVSTKRSDGTWDEQIVTQTSNYGSKSGTVVTRASGSDITVNRSHTLVLPEGATYRMHMSAIEWDEFGKRDHRMDGETVTEANSAGGKLKYEHGLDLGPNVYCRLKLYVDATETPL